MGEWNFYVLNVVYGSRAEWFYFLIIQFNKALYHSAKVYCLGRHHCGTQIALALQWNN